MRLSGEEHLLHGRLSGESKRSKRVHDEVDPEKLNWLERTLLQDTSSDEGGDESNNVDSELELEEPSDIVIDVSSPHASLNN